MTTDNDQCITSGKSTLLAVDDRPNNLYVLRELIAEHLPQCELVTTVSAKEGLEIASSRPLDGILLDVQMPEMTGIEMCKRLKANDRTAHIPVILITTHKTTPEFKAQGLDAGAEDFLTRPIDTVELGARIKVMLRIKRAEDDLREINIHLEDLVDERTKALRDSEERYRQLAENIKEVFWIVSPDWSEVIYISPAYEEVWGRSCESLYERPRSWLESVIEEDRGQLIADIEKKSAGDMSSAKFPEYRIVRPDGSLRWIFTRAFPIRDEQGEIYRIAGIAEDITGRRQMERALRESERRLDSIVKTVPDIIYRTDPQGIITFINDSVKKYGYNPEELIGTDILELVHPGDRKKAVYRVNERRTGERRTTSFEIRMLAKDKSGVPFEMESRSLEEERVFLVEAEGLYTSNKPKKKAFAGTQGIARDVTERKQAEEALRHSELRYRSLFDKMLNGFAFHEVVLDKNNEPVDYVFLEVNDAFEKLTGLKKEKIIGKRVTEVLPGIENSEFDWIGTCGKVAITGKEIEFEQYSEPLSRWYSVSAYSPKRGYFAVLFEDITERKRAEEVLRHSEGRFRELAELLPQIVFEADGRGVLTFINHQAFELTGYTQEDFEKGFKTPDFLIPGDRKRAKRNIKKVMRGETPVHNECTARRKDGSRFPVIIRATRIMHEGRPVGLRGIIFDITEQKMAEKALRREHSKLETGLKFERLVSDVASRLNSSESFHDIMDELLETIGEILEIDSACFFRFEYNYQSAVKLNKWSSSAEDQKTSFLDVIQSPMAPAFFKRIKSNKPVISADLTELAEEERNFFENQGIKAVLVYPLSVAGRVKGFLFFVMQDEYPWLDEEINASRTIAAIIAGAWERDLHSQALLEAERKQAEAIQMAEKAARLASLGTLAAGIAHEINQPLTALKVEVDGTLLRLEKNKQISMDENVETLNFVSSQASRINEIVTHMRALARQEKAEKPTSLNLNRVVRKALSLVDEQISSHGIELIVETDESLPLVESHGTLLEQVVINLVVNAMHALDAHESGEKTIEVSTSYSGENAVLTVRDNGPGIEPEHLDHIFDPFFTTKTNGVGMGLGLSITENLVTGLGGTVSAMNHEKGGAVFIVSLPVSTSNR